MVQTLQASKIEEIDELVNLFGLENVLDSAFFFRMAK
jgi:hypothetical protein